MTEIYCHPATADTFDGSASGYRYVDELAALTAPGVRDAPACDGRPQWRFFTDFPAPLKYAALLLAIAGLALAIVLFAARRIRGA